MVTRKKSFFLLLSVALLSNLLSAKAEILHDSVCTTPHPVQLSEVTIDASRSMEKRLNLAASASVLQGEELENLEIHSLKQATAWIPNFVAPEYGSVLTSPVYIRGVGSRINAPAVGLYVDNIPCFDKSVFDFEFLNLEKLEVLRGPQGSLYGRNSMGGIIHAVSRSPMEHPGTQFRFSLGGQGSYRINAVHRQRLSRTWGYALAGGFHHTDGYFTNAYTGQKMDSQNAFASNFRLYFQPVQQWKLNYTARVDLSDQGGYPYALYDADRHLAGTIRQNQAGSYSRTLVSQALNLHYSTDRWECTETLSGQWLDDAQRIDQDFSADSIYFASQFQHQRMLNNELLFRSKGTGAVQWMLGVFAFVHHLGSDIDVTMHRQRMLQSMRFQQRNEGLATFGQVVWNASGNLQFTAGLRIEGERASLWYRSGMGAPQTLTLSLDTIYPRHTESMILPKFAVRYKWNDVTLYGTYTTGGKPGGYNNTFEKPEHLTFRGETSNQFEIGSKGEFLNKRLLLEASLFHTRLENQQIYLTAPSGRGSYLANAGSSLNQGVECSVFAHPAKGSELSLVYGYTHARITQYQKDASTSYNGCFTPYVPRYTLAIQAGQVFTVTGKRWMDHFRVDLMYQHIGPQYWDLGNQLEEKAYGLLQAKMTFQLKKNKLEFWGKNLLNRSYNAFVFEALNQTFAQAGRPLQWGMNYTINW